MCISALNIVISDVIIFLVKILRSETFSNVSHVCFSSHWFLAIICFPNMNEEEHIPYIPRTPEPETPSPNTEETSEEHSKVSLVRGPQCKVSLVRGPQCKVYHVRGPQCKVGHVRGPQCKVGLVRGPQCIADCSIKHFFVDSEIETDYVLQEEGEETEEGEQKEETSMDADDSQTTVNTSPNKVMLHECYWWPKQDTASWMLLVAQTRKCFMNVKCPNKVELS